MSRKQSVDLSHYPHLLTKGNDAMKLSIKNARLSFSNLFEPRAFEEGQEKKYGATFLIPKDSPQVKEIEKAILEAATTKWGAKAKATLDSLRGNSQKYCFTDGDLKDYDGYEGHMALSAKNAKRPLIIDRDKTPLTAEDGRPYDGSYVVASIELWMQDNKWGKGVRATLRGVQFYKDGDAFAGGAPASEDEFDDLDVGSEESLV